MAETAAPAPASAPAASPAPAAAPAAAATPAPAPVAAPAAPPVPAAAPAPAPASLRPSWLPESHWDSTLNALNLNALQQDFEAKTALAARKPEDIKFPTKLPDDIKMPDGATWKMKPDDPLAASFRKIAVEKGFTQDQIDAVHNMWARQNVGDYIADQQAAAEFEAAENKKLGENATARKDAIINWLNASGLEPDERMAVASRLTDAASVTAFEKIIRKVIGGVPASAGGSTAPAAGPAEPPKTIAQRMYPNMPSRDAPQQKVG